MSALRQVELTCDACERVEVYQTASIREARRKARSEGWITGKPPTVEKPSRYSDKRDVCQHCKGTA